MQRVSQRKSWLTAAREGSLFGMLIRLILLLALGFSAPGAELLPAAPGIQLWWDISASAKIRPHTRAPAQMGTTVRLDLARNEGEAAQLVIRPEAILRSFELKSSDLTNAAGQVLASTHITILQARYVNIQTASDGQSEAGLWPDPLLPVSGPVDLPPHTNSVFWIRIQVPSSASAGIYRGVLTVGEAVAIPLEIGVRNFTLPDRLSCTTAFGFSAGEVFRYHGLKTEADRRQVLDKYLANLSAHHISPYDPAPLDPIKVRWPDVRPPRSVHADWVGLRLVTNEVHSGGSALLLLDEQADQNVTTTYEPLIPIPEAGLDFTGWFRAAIPGQRFMCSFNHYDASKQWMSGRNRDVVIMGSGQWQKVALALTNFPAGSAYVKLHLRATQWTDAGEKLGLAWADDLSLLNRHTGAELLTGGDFEISPRTVPVVPAEQLQAKLDFGGWDSAMQRAMDGYHFNSFRLHFPGIGGGTFHELFEPELLGFREQDPEYLFLIRSYGEQLEEHIRERGWSPFAYFYWFDEPSPEQYPFVLRGFNKLRDLCPSISRMLTEQVEPGLIGGPNIWCPISNEYDPAASEERRRAGDKFWWYVCTGPKAPYAGLFIDHGAPEMRIWLWQSWQRGIEGILVWQINYWTSGAAYPDRSRVQNPYKDPMSWTSGYSTAAGRRLPWGNGDGRFLYPPMAAAAGDATAPVLEGPVDSIRWEHLRDGIEDYEYFVILRNALERAGSTLAPAELAAYRALLQVPPEVSRSMTDFARDGSALEAHRGKLASAIEKLAPAL